MSKGHEMSYRVYCAGKETAVQFSVPGGSSMKLEIKEKGLRARS